MWLWGLCELFFIIAWRDYHGLFWFWFWCNALLQVMAKNICNNVTWSMFLLALSEKQWQGIMTPGNWEQCTAAIRRGVWGSLRDLKYWFVFKLFLSLYFVVLVNLCVYVVDCLVVFVECCVCCCCCVVNVDWCTTPLLLLCLLIVTLLLLLSFVGYVMGFRDFSLLIVFLT